MGERFFELLQAEALTGFGHSGVNVAYSCFWEDKFEVTAEDHQFADVDFLLVSMVVKANPSLYMLSCVEKENFI